MLREAGVEGLPEEAEMEVFFGSPTYGEGAVCTFAGKIVLENTVVLRCGYRVLEASVVVARAGAVFTTCDGYASVFEVAA